ncbi:hypothetical protein [Rummeliibacillus suwonensis]|uniref:hypothetical protein n=1 Tax=Rummeliibacillus suwonensis TaxID=1306154 RepID=UPI00289E804E|nr:hypothetical protein [Rummeliibacillus suwonensis]
MIRNKVALILSAIILSICMFLFFPFPNNKMLDARSTFMSFPITNQDGYIVTGIIGSVLFIIAMILLVLSLKKYHFRTIVIVIIVYTFLPKILITMYQETLASDIMAISYDGNGSCDFEHVREDLINGKCDLVLHNHSNEDVTFELEFLDSYIDDGIRAESLMNVNGPYSITIKANHKKTIYLKEKLDLSDVPKHIDGGASVGIHVKLIDGKKSRVL